MQEIMPLAADFPNQDESRWRALAEKALNGAPWAKLQGRTADGLVLEPLYRAPDIGATPDIAGAPGHAPFTRGAAAALDAFQPWHVRQSFAYPAIAASNFDILADLEGGVSALELVIDPAGEQGIAVRAAADMQALLQGVLLSLAPIGLDAGPHGLAAAGWLAETLRGKNAAPPAFNLDPLSVLARTGAVGPSDLAQALAFAKANAADFPGATFLRVDARPVHEAGGSEGQELGAALAAGAAYMRAALQAGFSADAAAGLMQVSLSVGPDTLIETAKLRALRLVWSRMLEAFGVAAPARAARLHAVTSRRMMTKRDPWTNILRAAAAAFAAAIGGAHSVTALPLTDALGQPDAFARRIARNVQLILMEECQLGRVIDPAGGSFFVEKLTRDLAQTGWAFFQKIEAAGGFIAALQAQVVQDAVLAVRAAREKNFATRRETITGLTDYPLLDERVPTLAPPAAIAPSAPAARQDGLSAKPLEAMRWAAPFEALRDAADAQQKRPQVFFATLGPLAEFSTRGNFAANLFGVAGVAAFQPEALYPDDAAIAASFAQSGLSVAIIAGADAAYAARAQSVAAALKQAGAAWVILAGKPGEAEQALRAAGIDQFVFAGQDILQSLSTLHAALGIAQ